MKAARGKATHSAGDYLRRVAAAAIAAHMDRDQFAAQFVPRVRNAALAHFDAEIGKRVAALQRKYQRPIFLTGDRVRVRSGSQAGCQGTVDRIERILGGEKPVRGRKYPLRVRVWLWGAAPHSVIFDESELEHLRQ